MYCRNCGQQLPEEAKFCPFCGTDVPDLEALLAAARAQQARQAEQAVQESQSPQAVPEPAGTEEKLFLYEDLPADDAEETADAAGGTAVPPAVSERDETMVLPEEFVQQYGQAEVYNADMPRGKRQQEQTINSARAYIPEEDVETDAGEDAAASGLQRIPKGALAAILAVIAVLLIFLSAFLTVRVLDSSAEDEVSVTQEAQSAYNEGDYETAISVLENWLDGADSATSTVYRLLARSYVSLGDVEHAAEVYAAGYEATGQQTLADSAVELWLQIAAEADSSTDAAYYYNLVLTLDPDNETALNALNETETSAGDAESETAENIEDETEEDAEAGTEDTAAESSLSDSEQAQAFYDAGDYNGAEVLLYSMRRSGNMSADDYALYGLVLIAQDREDSAVTTYYEGYTETGDTSLLDAGTALALELAAESVEKGDYEVAQIWYETILEYDSTNAEAAAGLETVDELLNPAEPVYETQYTVVTGSYTWEEARLEAAALGGQLAVITDLDTWNSVIDRLNGSLVTAAWIGGRTGTPGDWDAAIWVDGSSISYTRWYTGQPDGESSYLSLVLQDSSWYYSAAYEDLSAAGEVTGFVMETTAEVSTQ